MLKLFFFFLVFRTYLRLSTRSIPPLFSLYFFFFFREKRNRLSAVKTQRRTFSLVEAKRAYVLYIYIYIYMYVEVTTDKAQGNAKKKKKQQQQHTRNKKDTA